MEKMKICLISKYPPHRGGTANGNYWYAKTLGELGHEVHVVTRHVKEEDNYFRNLDEKDMRNYELKTVKVHAPKRELPSKHEIPSIVNLAVDVIRENDIDVIEAKYVLPYGVIGFLTKSLTGKKLMVKLVGNDMLMSSMGFGTVITEVLKNSDMISIVPTVKDEMIKMGVPEERITFKAGANYSFFNPDVKPYDFSKELGRKTNAPLIGCMGKILKNKGIYELLKAASMIDEDFSLLINDEKGMEEVKRMVKEFGLEKKVIFLDYQPPWRMPSIYNSMTAIVSTEVEFPIKIHTPLMAIEALRAGVCTIISKESHEKITFKNLKDRDSAIIVDPKNTEEYAKTLRWVINNPNQAKVIGTNARNLYKGSDCDKNTMDMVRVYKEMIS